jgi:hypothetical protein
LIIITHFITDTLSAAGGKIVLSGRSGDRATVLPAQSVKRLTVEIGLDDFAFLGGAVPPVSPGHGSY